MRKQHCAVFNHKPKYTMPDVYRVAVPTPLNQSFDYLPPAHPAQPLEAGTRVLVPLGRQTLVGIVLGKHSESEIAPNKLRAILKVLDPLPIFDDATLSLCQWASQYYQHPLGETLHAALPVELRKESAATRKREPYWVLTTKGKGLTADAFKRSPKQQQLFELLLQQGALAHSRLSQFDLNLSVCKALQTKELITQVDSVASTPTNQELLAEAQRTPTTEQADVLKQLRYHHYGTYLLEGATGSGKTEVYLQAIARVLNEGKQALVLVPEIGLTPLTLARFKQRFHVPVVELHSNVAKGQRTQNWLMAAEGEARVVIGTRLAIFTPMPALGIIIIDEEHDSSFKQQEGLRYSARDVAVMRAHRCQIPLVLGSATPSLESLHNAIQGRYEHLRLTQRAGAAQPPLLQCLDMRKTDKQGPLALHTFNEIQTTLARGEQVLVFINRRGFAPALLCEHCGWVASCQACSARMTLHQAPRHLHCHHCDAKKGVPNKCPSCHNPQLNTVGQGTEKIEQWLAQQLPSANIIRVDQDSMARKNAMAELTQQLHKGEPCILVGTQMLAKGHHFPKVTLAVLLDVDQALFSGDFRALERLGQQVVQVAGRAGREALPGKVLLQSYQADHPLLELLLNQGYHRYARTLLAERKAANLPPYWYMVMLRAESKRAENAQSFLKLALNLTQKIMPPSPNLKTLGPLPALLEKRQDRYRYQLQITASQRPQLQQLLRELLPELQQHALAKRVRWSVDVDPADAT